MKNKGISIMLACSACALALALAGCGGGASSGNAAPASGSGGASASGSAATSSSSAEASGASGSEAASEYVDANGNLAVKALVELDGAALLRTAEAAGYTWNADSCSWKKSGSSVHPFRGLTREEYDASSGLDAFDFTADEVGAFAVGAKGAPVMWSVSNSKVAYGSGADVLADQQIDVADQCAVENSSYGIETWALVRNSAGDEFLLEIRYESGDTSCDMLLYTADYVATEESGISSAFLFVPDGLYDAHAIDDAWAALKAAAA